MKGYLLSILGVIVAGLIVDIVLPNGQMNKYIKSIYSIFVVFVIVSPIITFLSNKKDIYVSVPNVELNQKLLNYIDEIEVEALTNEIEKTLKDNGFENVDILIKYYRNNNKIIYDSCEINIKNMVISSDKQHINKYEFISDVVKEKTNLTDAEVVFYA